MDLSAAPSDLHLRVRMQCPGPRTPRVMLAGKLFLLT